MKKIELSKTHFLKIINHKNKNILRVLKGFIELNSKSGGFEDKINECLLELSKVSNSLDLLYLEKKDNSLSQTIEGFCSSLNEKNYEVLEDGVIFKDINKEFDLESTYFAPFIPLFFGEEIFLYGLAALLENDYDIFAIKKENTLKLRIISK